MIASVGRVVRAGLGWAELGPALLGVCLLQHCAEARHPEAHPTIPELQSHSRDGWDQMPMNYPALWKGERTSQEAGKQVGGGRKRCLFKLRHHRQGNLCPQGGRGQ